MTGKDILTICPEAKKSRMPRRVTPMKATLVDAPFSRTGWLFEEKYDGIRTMGYVKAGKHTLYSRNQKEMTFRYPELSDLPKVLRAKECVIDGEIVVIGKSGAVDFGELQARFGVTDLKKIEALRKAQKIVFYVFDVLYVDGYNLMGCPLLERKRLLKALIKPGYKLVKYSTHIRKNGEKLFAKAEARRTEGIMAKNEESVYEERRSNEWLKIKTSLRQEVVIVGYTEPHGSRKHFGSLHLGLYDDKGVLHSIGHVGTGFDQAGLKALFDRMKPLRTDSSPFAEEVETNGQTQWLKPKLVAEVRFTEMTGAGSLRHPVFMGLREDKKPKECKLEVQRPVAREVKTAEKRTARIVSPLVKRRKAS